jgi:hypothetical protein
LGRFEEGKKIALANYGGVSETNLSLEVHLFWSLWNHDLSGFKHWRDDLVYAKNMLPHFNGVHYITNLGNLAITTLNSKGCFLRSKLSTFLVNMYKYFAQSYK